MFIEKDSPSSDNLWLAVPTYILGQVHLMPRKPPKSNMLSSTELSAGMVCSCMPICACLLRGHIPKDIHYLSPRQIYLNLRSRSSRRPRVLNQVYSLEDLSPPKRDSYLGTRSDDYAQLGKDSGVGETKTSVKTQRERLEY